MALKTKPPPGEKMAAALQNLAAHLRGRAERQHLLRVDAAAPERQPVAILRLQLRGVHARGRALHRVEDIEAGLDEAGQRAESPSRRNV